MFRRHYSKFRGKNKQKPIIPWALIVHSSRFWQDNLCWISCMRINRNSLEEVRLLTDIFIMDFIFELGKSNEIFYLFSNILLFTGELKVMSTA